jgi:ribonuclease BN (tRNA processing enzyme)
MRITVIGCSGSFPGPDSPASCYLLEADGADGRSWRVLLELGNGALGALHNYIDPLSVDGVLVSHLHPDHYMDLCGYYVLRRYGPQGQQRPIPVWGPAGIADRMAHAYGLPLDPGMREDFDFHEYDGRFDIGPFTVEPVEVDHPVLAYGLRISADGATFGYSGDTGPCEGLDRVAADVPLLIAEASFRSGDDNPPHIHLTGADCGSVANRKRVGRLVLTHIPPWFEKDMAKREATAVFAGDVEIARPGAVYEL